MQSTVTPTHCPYCALQCGMNLTPAPDGTVEVSERADFPVNRGALCGKGRTAAAVLAPGVRLTSPLVRDEDGTLVPASWDERWTGSPRVWTARARSTGRTRSACSAGAG